MAILRMACIQTGRDDGSQLEAANPIEDMRLIRSAALDEWVGLPKRTDERLPERHMVAHGGRVMLDIDTIQAHHQLQRVTAWKEAFKNKLWPPLSLGSLEAGQHPRPYRYCHGSTRLGAFYTALA